MSARPRTAARLRSFRALRAAVAAGSSAALLACGPRPPGLQPDPGPKPASASVDAGAPYAEQVGTPTTPRPVPSSLITHGVKAALFSREPLPPGTAACTKEERKALTFEHAPTYSAKVEKEGTFTARLFVGNGASCTRRVSIPLSFTPPKTTATRTVDIAAYVPPRGSFVDVVLDPEDLRDANVTPGRYAITFAVVDEDGKGVGRALSGNPFRLGRDEVELAARPELPAKIAPDDDLVVPFVVQNVGDTANKVTPLVVFTRPGDTNGIEHYEPQQLVIPGTSTYTLRLTKEARQREKIGPGAWLVTVTMFDAAGDRLNSFAGIPLSIGSVDLKMTRPELPARVRKTEPIRVRFQIENKGDTTDKVTAVVAFTKPGTTTSRELTFTREIAPGMTVYEAIVDPARRREKGIDGGVWLVTTAAFKSSGERVKSFTGHYLEIGE